MKQINIKLLLGCSALVLASQACTDLSETTYDVIPTSGTFGSTAGQQAALIGPLYNGLGDYYGNMSNLNTTTDEQIVPTRGGDWKDSDNWKRLYQHTWDPVTDNGQFNGPWTWCYNNITSINQQLGSITDVNTKAELRALRAFFHYQAMDLFGNVIISDAVTAATPKQNTRAEVFAFVEKELLAVYPSLSDVSGGAYYGRMNKWAADMILAKMYLNAQVYTGTPRWADCITRCDNIIKSGKFVLAGDYFANFVTQNQGSKEIILATPFDKSKREGMNVQMKTLHYLNQLTYNLGTAPWNGWATVTEFYNSFDDKDARKKQWIVGQQYDAAGKPLMDDALPMVFRPEVESFVFDAGANGRLAGARSQKYQIQANNTFTSQDNDFVIYRLADVLMMSGEANFRLGNVAAAVSLFNSVRARTGMPDYTSATLNLNEILAERGRELAWEQHRRQDLIRFGQYTKAWRLKPASQDFRQLFPIPKDQLSLNPNLKQNPGY
ncbi:RagB/SusD family nutrient uptake outer membrane protein [Spirosoma sp. BT702]|uniref:RagB/SusD family nutrient uptake outer membrane protein n=1 Tax=Spirosoma profusum TaxID=2771354 RepID=A0A927ARK5_9BACT|nr:RagB/SusD family nutrient uptake outer membrane protein [Spirosoma profusum]MBD2702478.1 RagB/SusD family nutrient uptake outer membrane protein [Spirosoma profusum]